MCLALSVPIGHNHSISRHRLGISSQKFNKCDFVASTQAFVAKAGIACEHWCPYIVRHRAPLCVLLTHVWKSVLIKLNYVFSKYNNINKNINDQLFQTIGSYKLLFQTINSNKLPFHGQFIFNKTQTTYNSCSENNGCC